MDEMNWEAMLGREIEWLHTHPLSEMDEAEKITELQSLLFQASGMLHDIAESMVKKEGRISA